MSISFMNLARRAGVILLTTAAVMACGRHEDTGVTSDSAAGRLSTAHDSGAADSSIVVDRGATPAVGPGIQVTRTDGRSVMRATDYKLTEDSWKRFLAAADSVSALRARDAEVQRYLAVNLTDAGSTDVDAGVKYLEANPKISAAIANGGLTVKDYFRLGIATASAARFMRNPQGAPPTPALSENAKFLQNHAADLGRLEDLTAGRPVVRAS
jgi:hypothetical protein